MSSAPSSNTSRKRWPAACVGLYLAAVFGTRDSTPLHGAAQSASAWTEGLVTLTLVMFGVALMAGTALALWGFGQRPGRRRAP